MYPDFLCIGANKGGTTWLYYNLRQHKGIWLPPHKEIHYFDGLWPDEMYRNAYHLEKKVQDASSTKDPELIAWLRKFGLVQPRDDAWYESLFEDAGNRLAGDITPAYSIVDPKTVAHAHSIMPDAKIIFIMRDPIERAWSQFCFDHAGGEIPLDDLPDEAVFKHVDSDGSELRGNYPRTIRNWSSCYPPEQIKYAFFDDLNRNPENFLSGICGFLGLDFDPRVFAGTMRARWNESPKRTMAPHIAKYIARKYAGQVAELEAMFGGVTTEWLNTCYRILTTP